MSHPAPIGVFDSGIGGLSILKALRAELPHESFVYFADSAYAPYGERDDAHVVARSLAVTGLLKSTHNVKALVVACNTATAVAIGAIRAQHPNFPVVGVEPAIKPALSQTRTGHIGVLATRRTLASEKFNELLTTWAKKARFTVTPCDGLARAIEARNESEIRALIQIYTRNTGAFGSKEGNIDTLVLGCTHYPLEQTAFQRAVGNDVALVEPGAAVARRLSHVLKTLGRASTTQQLAGGVMWLSSASDLSQLTDAVRHWLPETL